MPLSISSCKHTAVISNGLRKYGPLPTFSALLNRRRNIGKSFRGEETQINI
ncbi:hypothetical protein HYC85_023916 [Camellia sinensis]|uniref:Uncharacterized protein n=1 Tax=Camellia sinensis TaxID=4442 RepID=A0A7J7GGN9_CAMSI|nr:hypothetical protein HYC85_023916 [Camellia sinensis]